MQFTASNNRMLASLTSGNLDALLSQSRMVELPGNTVLYQAGKLPEDAYFLTSGFASQVIYLEGGGSAETGVIGTEGVVGYMPLLGQGRTPDRCMMQADGGGYAIPIPVLQDLFRSSEQIRERILEFVQQQTMCGSYLAACNKLHATELRLARWILIIHNRLATEYLPLTQELLAQMLGTRRMTVTVAAGTLQRSGLIEYRRGQLRIVNHAGLEAAACECYRPLKALYDQLYRA